MKQRGKEGGWEENKAQEEAISRSGREKRKKEKDK